MEINVHGIARCAPVYRPPHWEAQAFLFNGRTFSGLRPGDQPIPMAERRPSMIGAPCHADFRQGTTPHMARKFVAEQAADPKISRIEVWLPTKGSWRREHLFVVARTAPDAQWVVETDTLGFVAKAQVDLMGTRGPHWLDEQVRAFGFVKLLAAWGEK